MVANPLLVASAYDGSSSQGPVILTFLSTIDLDGGINVNIIVACNDDGFTDENTYYNCRY